MRRVENISPSLRWVTSSLATTMAPLVCLSRRCTMPGRSSPPTSESLRHVVQQRVDQRAAVARVVGRACAGVDHHAGGLVDHGEVLVLVEDVERECPPAWRAAARDAARLRSRWPRRRAACAWPWRGAVDAHLAGFDQQLHAGAADLRNGLREIGVQAHAGGGGVGDKGADAVFRSPCLRRDRAAGDGLPDRSFGPSGSQIPCPQAASSVGTDGASARYACGAVLGAHRLPALAFGQHMFRGHAHRVEGERKQQRAEGEEKTDPRGRGAKRW